MSKKIFVGLFIIISLVFSYTFVFAADGVVNNAADGVRNMVGGAENAVEDAAKGISGASKNITGEMTDNRDKTNQNMDGINNGNDGIENENTVNNDRINTTNGTGYATTRTATTDTFMGMTSAAWTWLVLAVAAVVIIALVWYYSTQITRDNYNNRKNIFPSGLICALLKFYNYNYFKM